jgi:hypothetical protein
MYNGLSLTKGSKMDSMKYILLSDYALKYHFGLMIDKSLSYKKVYLVRLIMFHCFFIFLKFRHFTLDLVNRYFI